LPEKKQPGRGIGSAQPGPDLLAGKLAQRGVGGAHERRTDARIAVHVLDGARDSAARLLASGDQLADACRQRIRLGVQLPDPFTELRE